jgi:choline-sulfatase
LEGGDANWRNEAISQVGEHVMIKQDDLKYQYYGEKLPELLFDLAADPGETRDFSKDAGYQKAMSRFRTRLREIGRGEIYPQGR